MSQDVQIKDAFRARFFLSLVKQMQKEIESIIRNVNEQLQDGKKVEYSKEEDEIIKSGLTKLVNQMLSTLDDFILPSLVRRISEYVQLSKPNTDLSYTSFFLNNDKSPSENVKNFVKENRLLLGRMKCFVHEFVENIRECSSILISEYNSNGKELLKIINFSEESEIKLLSVEASVSDRHGGGKQVVILSFNGNRKLVYKPFGLDTAIAFSKIINLVNEKIVKLYQLTCATIYLPKHSNDQCYFCEFIERKDCSQIDEFPIFWKKCGILTAVCSLFGFTDGHWENIITRGSNPILIDTETFFHPYVKQAKLLPEMSPQIYQQILMTGLIQEPPNPISISKNEGWISAFQHEEKFSSFEYKPVVINDQTPDIRITLKKRVDYATNILPKLTKPTPIYGYLYEYANDFIMGFKDGFKAVLECNSFFTSIIDSVRFVRLVPRHTSLYYYFQSLSLLPEYLQNSSLLLEKLKLYNSISGRCHFFGNRGNTEMEKIERLYSLLNRIEYNNIQNSDIPLFRILFDKGDMSKLLDSSGNEIPNFTNFLQEINQSKFSIHNYIDNIKQFSNNIDEIFENISPKLLQICTKRPGIDFSIQIHDVQSLYIQLAQQILGEVQSKLSTCSSFSFIEMFSVHEGIGGSILVLSLVFSQEEEFLYLVDCFCKKIEESTEMIKKHCVLGIGVGIGSLIFVLSFLAIQLSRVELLEIVSNILRMYPMSQMIDQDEEYDIIFGSSGLILALNMHKKACIALKHEFDQVENLIFSLVSHLVQSRKTVMVKSKEYNVWKNNGSSKTGFSHGQAGIYYALFNTSTNIQESFNLKEIIQECIDFEDECLDLKRKNWSGTYGDDIYMSKWCYGAPGIVASRVKLFSGIGLEYFDSIKDSLLENNGLGLCCGKCGILDCLLEISQNCNLDLSEFVNSVVIDIMKGVLSNSMQLPTEDISLFNGLSGLVYIFFKIANPSSKVSFTFFHD